MRAMNPMTRRDLLGIASAATVALAADRALAQKKDAKKPTPPTATDNPHAHHQMGADALQGAAAECIQRGEACLAHCIALLSEGKTEMAGCAKSVRDMLAAARALLSMASAGSKHLKAQAKVTADVARDCEAECKKHPEHAVCKACGECCARLVAEIAKLG
jgi:Cys-rich four helix bundle protein (predicted Tat secretion target)